MGTTVSVGNEMKVEMSVRRGIWVQLLGDKGPALVLFLFYVNAPEVSLVLPAFDDTDALGYHLRMVVYRPSVSPWWGLVRMS